MTIQFTTRRGTNQYHGSLYEQLRNDALNANEFFNNMRHLPKTRVRMNDFGGSFGGPLKIPFVPALKEKLFFFVNYEDAPRPGSANTSATLLTSEAQSGVFRFVGTDGAQHTINVLQLAGASGYQNTIDPTVASVLNVINGTVSRGTGIPSASNYYQQSLNWRITTGSHDYYPTARIDYQVMKNLAWHTAWNLQHQHVNPTGSSYPGLPGQAGESKFTRYALSNGIDWTVTPRLFNSVKFGIQSSVSGSNIGNSVNQWSVQGDKRVSYGLGISSFIPNATPLIRTNPAVTVSDDLSWMKGKHIRPRIRAAPLCFSKPLRRLGGRFARSADVPHGLRRRSRHRRWRPSGICPAAGGDPSAGFRYCGILLANKFRSARARTRARPVRSAGRTKPAGSDRKICRDPAPGRQDRSGRAAVLPGPCGSAHWRRCSEMFSVPRE
jgi:hypothetical protein